jgi:hypothetical protein
MSSLSNPKSLSKAPEREPVSDDSEQRLCLGLPPPQGITADGSKLSQVTFFAQVAPNRQHPILHFPSHTVGRLPRPSRPVAEIDPIQAQTLSSLNPSLDGKQTDAKLPRHPAQGSAAANRGHHLATTLCGAAFLFIFILQHRFSTRILTWSC